MKNSLSSRKIKKSSPIKQWTIQATRSRTLSTGLVTTSTVKSADNVSGTTKTGSSTLLISW